MLAFLFFAWRSRSARTTRAFALLRVLAFLTVASTLISLACARRAKAEMATNAVKVGRDLLPIVQELGGAATVSLNGQRVILKYDATTRTVRQVLDSAEETCRQGGVEGGVRSLTDRDKPFLSLPDLGIVRSGNDDEGLVMCFAKGENTRATLKDQVAALVDTSDLGSLGKLRYVYARTEGKGKGSAALVALTEDSFRLDALDANVVGGEDSPGSDDPSLPRPPSSTRFLSALIEGAPYATRGYRTRLPADEVRATYDGAMLARGFTTVEMPAKKTSAYSKDGVLVTFATALDKNGDTLVSIGTMGADDHRRTQK